MLQFAYLKENIRLLNRVRWILLVLQVFIVLAAIFFYQRDLSLWFSLAIASCMAIHNFLSSYWLRNNLFCGEKAIFFHLILDSFWIYFLLLFYGAKENPFSFILAYHVIMAASMLPKRWTWFLSFLTIIQYGSLFLFPGQKQLHVHHSMSMNWHLYGMLVSFVALVFLIAFFVSRLNSLLRKQQQIRLENEELLSLGHFAGFAAHRLGTPLGSISLIAEDLESPDHESLALLKQEVLRCKDIISSITQQAGVARAEKTGPVDCNSFFQKLIHDWRQEKALKVELTFLEQKENFLMNHDPGVVQALYCLLDNAFEAGATWLKVSVSIKRQQLKISVQDNGPGFCEQFLSDSPKIGASNKAYGMGMGLFLVSSVVHRLGGLIKYQNNHIGGIVLLSLDLSEVSNR